MAWNRSLDPWHGSFNWVARICSRCGSTSRMEDGIFQLWFASIFSEDSNYFYYIYVCTDFLCRRSERLIRSGSQNTLKQWVVWRFNEKHLLTIEFCVLLLSIFSNLVGASLWTYPRNGSPSIAGQFGCNVWCANQANTWVQKTIA